MNNHVSHAMTFDHGPLPQQGEGLNCKCQDVAGPHQEPVADGPCMKHCAPIRTALRRVPAAACQRAKVNKHANADTYSGSSAEVIEVRHSLAKAIRSCCSSAFAAGHGFCCKRNFTHV